IGYHDTPLDQIIPCHRTACRVSETHDRRDIFRLLWQGLTLLRPPASVITWLHACLHLLFTHGVQLFSTTVAIVGSALIQHLLDDLLIAIHTLHLIERTLIPVQPQPAHAIQ